MLQNYMRMFSSLYECVVFVDFASYIKGCFIASTRWSSNLSSSNIICILVHKLICRCLSNALYKVSYSCIFVLSSKQVLKTSEVHD